MGIYNGNRWMNEWMDRCRMSWRGVRYWICREMEVMVVSRSRCEMGRIEEGTVGSI